MTRSQSRRSRNVIKSAVAAGVIVMAAATPALAGTVNVGGGTWSYGTSCCSMWSNYKHVTANHSSSVQGDYWAYSGCTAPGLGYWPRWGMTPVRAGRIGKRVARCSPAFASPSVVAVSFAPHAMRAG
ncbi:lactococcin 972 family bacteriocin [Streptomyces sp. NPDC004609]|uniref:lactococcin 972 family bacteriocin n=1 Tax=Streptomyces sp. NPDC004609 TaxID=3364704 RepID=UPI00367FFE60